jgi:hypothetical protein
MHHICVGRRHKETHWKLLKQHSMGKRVRKCSGGGLHWLKHNACTGLIPMQKSQWTMNRHLNNKEQEWKTGHAKGRLLMGERLKEDKYDWFTLCARINIECLNLLTSP